MIALTIAGSDPSGGAGIQADLKTMHQHGVFGTSVLTLLTVQNTVSVQAVQMLETTFVAQQLDAVLSDIPPAAAKTGALGSAAMVETVSSKAASFDFPLVVDPVMVSKHGDRLINDDAIALIRESLLPKAFLSTPNIHEASMLSGIRVEDVDSMEVAARKIQSFGVQNVLVKGGRNVPQATDVLTTDERVHRLLGQPIDSKNTHGSGCVLSAAITARLARGEPLLDAVTHAKAFTARAIRSAKSIGGGVGPLNLHADL